MEILKKIWAKLKRAKYAAPLAILTMGVPLFAHAQSSLLGDLTFKAITGVTFGITMLVGWIAGFIVALEAFAVEWMLQLSINVVSSPIVTVGFPVVLSLTNLIFVIGLIIIAISTILRIESYGLKNTLWKLLVMAVLVNFGLIIGGTILNFSDTITLYMVKAINPLEGGNSLSQFASIIAGAFQPQNGFIYNVEGSPNVSDWQNGFNAAGASLGQVVKALISVLLSIGGFTIIIIVLGALAVVLLMRYISVAFLLVGLPIAWASWPFPAFKHHFTGWWNKFLKQAFLPIPIVFFLWLGLVVAQEMGTQKWDIQTIGYGSGILAGIVSFMGNLLMPVVQSVMQMLLLGGIMAMGLKAAGSMGATFATTAQNAIKAGQNRAKGEITKRISNRAQRVRVAAQRGATQVQERLQTVKLGIQRRNEALTAATGATIERWTGGATRLGFNAPRARYKLKTDKDGNAVMTLDVASDSKKDVSFMKLIDSTTGKEVGEVEVDAAGNILASKRDAAGNLIMRDGKKIREANVSTGSVITEALRHVKFKDEKGNLIDWEVRQKADGNFETEKDANGDLLIKDDSGNVLGTAKKTGVQVLDKNGNVEKILSGGHLIDKKTGKVHFEYVDGGGHGMHAREAKGGSYWTEDQLKKLEERQHHLEEENDHLWEEAKRNSLAGSAAAVASAIGAELGKGPAAGGGGGGGGHAAPPAAPKGGGGHGGGGGGHH